MGMSGSASSEEEKSALLPGYATEAAAQLQRIDLPVAHIAHDDRRVVGSQAIPGLTGLR